jgi:flagellar hook-associated protein 1 FlgK
MSLGSALSIANSGLVNTGYGFTLLSQNIANASTPDYATEVAPSTALSAGDQPLGVGQSGAIRISDPSLEASLFLANGNQAYTSTQNDALQQISPTLGSVGNNNDLGSLTDAVSTAFSTLLTDPSSSASQAAVVTAAQSLTSAINTIANTTNILRQQAQNALVQQVASLNTALSQIGQFNQQIIGLKAEGRSTADLENQRNVAENTVSKLAAAHFLSNANGSVDVFLGNGIELPTDGYSSLTIANAQTGPQTFYPGGGLPGIMYNGADITSNLGGGAIAANFGLRDNVLPQFSAGLDEFAENLATRFAAQGLTLFSDGAGNVPASGGNPAQTNYLGFASVITVNPAVSANPGLVRDGTNTITGSATGASAYTPNPQNLPGFTGMISRILNYALGSDVQSNVAQPGFTTAALGASGKLTINIPANSSLGDFARSLTGEQSQTISNARTDASDSGAVQSSISGSLSAVTGVNTDSQISQLVVLQNAYAASAKIISTIETLMDITINMVIST